jgi:very-short-patch-repair endonuclease
MAKFDSHTKAQYWSAKNEKMPNEVALNSHKKFWFDCDKCNHDFDTSLRDINIGGNWCPYCVNKKICKNCEECFNKSFASIEYCKYFSSLNNENPNVLFKNSHKKYLFDCPICNHTFEQCLSHITRGNTCNYCHNRNLCKNIFECKYCLDKTFYNNERAKCWSSKNTKQPHEVFKSSGEEFIFNCDKCSNEFKCRLAHITNGVWCNNCRYKTEDKVFKTLLDIYLNVKTQYKVEWCKDKKYLPFDFVLEDKKIIIELDGEQHWKQVGKWKTPEHNRNRDLFKMKKANENGFSMIRIVQDDIYKNRYDWVTELKANIQKICDDNKIQNIYMCKNNEYKDFVI